MMPAQLFTTILRHEWRLLTRGRTATVALLLIGITVAYAAWSGTQWRREQLATIAGIQQQDEQVTATIANQLEEIARHGDPRPALPLAGMAWYIYQPEGAVAPAPHLDPRRAEAAASEWVGARHVYLPPAPFSSLAVGQSDLHPYYTRVTIRTRPILVNSDEIENPANLLNGRIDLAFVLTFCWPVLVLPLFYNVIAEERESGTLALVASQPVSLRRLLLTRLLIRGAAVVIVTIGTSLIVFGLFNGLEHVASADVAAWCAAVIATASFWCGLAAIVNLTAWRSAVNAAALTVAWVMFVVVGPAVLGELANAWAPVPSRVQLVNAVRTAGNLNPSELASLVSAYYEAHPDAAPSNQSADVTAIRGLAQQEEIDRRISPIVSAYRDAAARQQQLADRLRFTSPPLLIYDAVGELAGTTASRYRRFAEQVDRYHAAWREYFSPLVHARASITMTHYNHAPRFAFRDERDGITRLRALGLLAVAGAIGILLLAIALGRASATRVTNAPQ
jgi:ABC-2 type transport system permease protein